jgi:hypothetical protein
MGSFLVYFLPAKTVRTIVQQMVDNSDEYTHDLGTLVAEALEQGCMKWIHLHQTQDLETEEPRDIVQLQFYLC